MLAKNKKVSNLLVGAALISTVGTTTTTSLSLTSMLGPIFGLGMTGASVAVYLQELPIIFGLPLSAIAATLGIVGAHKAYEIYKKEPSILIPSDISKHILEREFGSMEKYHSELKSAWKYIGCSLATSSIGATINGVINQTRQEANEEERKITNVAKEKGSEQTGDTDSYVEKINKTTHEKKVSNLNKEDHSNYLKYLP